MSVCYIRLSYNLSESFEQTLHPTQEFSRWALDITWRGSRFLKPRFLDKYIALPTFSRLFIQFNKNTTTVKRDILLTRTLPCRSEMFPYRISLFEALCNLIIYHFHAICSSKLKNYYHICVKHEEKNYCKVDRWSRDRQKWGTEWVKSPHE